MIPMEAASFMSKPKNSASPMVKNIPAWAARPKVNITGFDKRGVKSIMAPTAINISKGKSSVAMPMSKRRLSAPSWTTPSVTLVMADERGMLTRIVPKPIGRSRFGSYFFSTANHINPAPISIIMKCL